MKLNTLDEIIINFGLISQLLKLRYNFEGHIFIPFVFPQFTLFHSVFHSFHGFMNSINWPASSVWVFIAQLVELCSAITEATGSNPVEALKSCFSGSFLNCLNCDTTANFISSFHLYSRSSHYCFLHCCC